MNFRYLVFVLSCLTLILTGCKKDKPAVPSINYGYNYFPNNQGHWVIYQADSTVYDQFNGKKYHYRYQIKEVIDTFFTDNSGRPTQLIYRYYRDTSSANWPPQPQKLWYGNLLTTDAERVENNIRYIKLSFPVQMSAATWNGNALNTMAQWQYQYTAVDVPATVGGVNFDSTATILQQSNSNGLQYQLYQEQYARKVGLISKQITDLSTDTIFAKWKSGVIYTQTYITSGN